MPHGQSFYNEETNSVDIILDSHTMLRLCCEKFLEVISCSPEHYDRIIHLAKEKPACLQKWRWINGWNHTWTPPLFDTSSSHSTSWAFLSWAIARMILPISSDENILMALARSPMLSRLTRRQPPFESGILITFLGLLTSPRHIW